MLTLLIDFFHIYSKFHLNHETKRLNEIISLLFTMMMMMMMIVVIDEKLKLVLVIFAAGEIIQTTNF